MKNILKATFLFIVVITIAGCSDIESTNEPKNENESNRNFNITEVATVNNTIVKINSVTKVEQDCLFEYSGECASYQTADNDYYLIIDLTIENTGNEDLNVSSILSFELKDDNGSKGESAFLVSSVKSNLDGTIVPNDKLNGQIAFDVSESDKYNFYYKIDLLADPIKFIINSSDIK